MKTINISVCSCQKYLEKDSWKPYKDIREIVNKRVRAQLPNAKIKYESIETPSQLKEKKEIFLKVMYKGDTYEPKVYVKMVKCNLCSREGTKYFEAVLQIRGSNEAVLERGVEYIQGRVEDLRHRGLFVNKIERFDDGFDLYMTSNQMAQRIGREMLDKFGGELKVNSRLFSHNKQTSKDLYRLNVFLKLPGFTRGDFIVLDERVFYVDKLGRKIKIIDMANGSSRILDYKQMDYRVLHKEDAYVSKTYPGLEVINPHDFQSSMIRNHPKKAYTVGERAKVVIYKGIYVVE